MDLSDFDYNLPRELIAQEPEKPRDHSRLLVCHRSLRSHPATTNAGHANFEDKHFYDIIDYLKKGDVLVVNDSKVFPARLIGKRAGSGGKLEVFLLRRRPGGNNFCRWQCLIGGRRARAGLEIKFEKDLACKLARDNRDGTWEAEFNSEYGKMMKTVGKIGEMPLPPYIKRVVSERHQMPSKALDALNYQTVYADDNKTGSVAAPTAGLHFTPGLLKKIKEKGVQIENITLHVGLGTFAPVKTEDITKHKMHSEFVEVEAGTVKRLREVKKEKRKIIAVGTTSVRTLESLSDEIQNSKSKIQNSSKFVNLFIYPGYKFKIVDAMITNFHLPKSTLLMLVSAFAGKESIDKAYKHAIKNKYRFYSYGDAMLIL